MRRHGGRLRVPGRVAAAVGLVQEDRPARSGAEAASWGLAGQALPAEDVLPVATRLAREIADHAAPVSLAVTKRLLWEAATADQLSAGRTERLLLETLLDTADPKEGVSAYLGKRTPEWSGRVSRDLPDWPDSPDP